MNLKQFLPVEFYTLVTKLSVEAVHARLEEKISAKKKFKFSATLNKYSKPYEGVLNKNSFTISRVIDYRNSFLPEITGRISNQLGQTHINVKMQPAIFVLVFISLWMGFVTITCLGIIIIGIIKFNYFIQHGVSPAILIPFVLFVFGSCLTYFAFKPESKKSKEFLANLLQGEEVSRLV
jgi:hypothetical protein